MRVPANALQTKQKIFPWPISAFYQKSLTNYCWMKIVFESVQKRLSKLHKAGRIRPMLGIFMLSSKIRLIWRFQIVFRSGVCLRNSVQRSFLRLSIRIDHKKVLVPIIVFFSVDIVPKLFDPSLTHSHKFAFSNWPNLSFHFLNCCQSALSSI